MSDQQPDQQPEGITFDQAIQRHPDLAQLLEAGKAIVQKLIKANEDVQIEARSRVQIPGTMDRLAKAQIELSTHLDKMAATLNEETKKGEGLRLELVKAIYQDTSTVWSQIFIQTHIARVSIREPARYHEHAMREAMMLLTRAQQGAPKTRVTNL